MRKKCECETCRNLRQAEPERTQGEYETACNVLLSLEQIVRKSDGWEDSAVEAVHNAVQTAIKCMHHRPQGEWAFDEKGNFYCDQCGKYPHDQYATTDFCPKCGACMKKGGKE